MTEMKQTPKPARRINAFARLLGWFNNLRIQSKLTLGFSLLIFLIIFSVSANAYASFLQTNALEIQTSADQRLATLEDMNANLQGLRQSEKNFLLDYPAMGVRQAISTYTVQKQSALANFSLSLTILRAQSEGATLPGLDTLQSRVNEYNLLFDQLFAAIQTRGFRDTGLEGIMQVNAAALEENTVVRTDLELQVYLLQMRRNEKDWALRSEFENVEALRRYSRLMQARILSLRLPTEQEIELNGFVNAYVNSFESLVDQDQAVADLRTRLDVVGRNMVQLINTLSNTERARAADAALTYDQIRQVTEPLQVIVLVVSVLVGIGLAILMARGISAPLLRLTESAEKMAAGDLSVRTDVMATDEIGQLSSTFNTMAERLADTLAVLQQRLDDLGLAADVGQQISAFRGLGELLSEVVELMRSRYNLYYTQVYLVDHRHQTLVLRAGSGVVGAELVRRGHRLPIGMGSINGRAALEMRPILVSDTAQSETFLPNPLLPGTRSEVSIPLLVGDRLVGVLNLQDTVPGRFTHENVEGIEALASQLAVAINNSQVFEQLTLQQQQAEQRLAESARSNWQNYLDLTTQSEQLVFDYTLGETIRKGSEVQDMLSPNTVTVPLLVSGQPVGNLQFELEEGAEPDMDLVRNVADQVSRQIESIRLLSEAERYRAEAEDAAAQLTREGWEAYLQQAGQDFAGFVFQDNVVKPIGPDDTNGSTPIVKKPILVRGEVIGELEIGASEDAGAMDEETENLVGLIVERLGNQLENLRLTEQTRRALLELQDSEEQLSETLRIAKMASWEFDMRRLAFTFNNQYYHLLGYTAEDFGGYSVSADKFMRVIVHPDDVKLIQDEIRKALQARKTGYSGAIQFKVLDKSRQLRYAELTFRVELDEHNRPVRAIGSQVDITERRQAEEAVRESRERFAIAVEGSNDGIWDWNLVTNEIYFSSRWKEMIGYADHELSNSFDEFERLLHSEDHDWVMQALQDYLDGKRPLYDIELRFVHKDGSFRWIRARGQALRDQNGRPLRMAGSHSDITDRKQAEQELAKRALELETVAEVGTAASTVLDAESLLQDVVDLTKDRFGLYHAHIYLVDELTDSLVLAAGAGEVGRRMVEQGWRISLNREQSLVARAARTRQGVIVNDVRAETGFLPNPELPETRSELAVPLMSGDRVLGVLDVQSQFVDYFTDVDIRIQGTLGAQVGVALQNARLYAEQAATVTRLQEMDFLKSAFLANMSHELRTPLNSIIGFTEVILAGLDGPLTDTMEEDLGVIHKNGQHLLELINEVLDMAKIEAGKMTLAFEPIDMREILDDVVNTSLPLANDRNIELLVEIEKDDVLHVEGDYTRIRQVLLNLAGNAIKFTNEGYVLIRAWKPEEALVQLMVKDTGIGIPPDYIDKVFESFSQVDTSSTRKTGGTGLGLPISRQLIELHGGRLWVESTGIEGEGTTFYIEMPVRQTVSSSQAEESLLSVDGHD